MWDFHHFCQIYQPILAILKVPKIPPLLGNSTKTVQLHKFLRDPRCFLLDHHSSYHYGHPAQPACTFHRKNPIDPARRPPSTTRAASAARQASTTASQDFFFFFHKILLLSNAIFFYISPSYYSLVNIFLRINSFIPFSDTICRQTEKQ